MVKANIIDNNEFCSSLNTKSKGIKTHMNRKPSCNVRKQVCPTSNYSNKFSNLQIYHQNIRGIHNKLDELFSQWESNIPQIFCFMEHHLSSVEIIRTSINQYNLGAYFCRKIR
jgi:hypothetical protein